MLPLSWLSIRSNKHRWTSIIKQNRCQSSLMRIKKTPVTVKETTIFQFLSISNLVLLTQERKNWPLGFLPDGLADLASALLDTVCLGGTVFLEGSAGHLVVQHVLASVFYLLHPTAFDVEGDDADEAVPRLLQLRCPVFRVVLNRLDELHPEHLSSTQEGNLVVIAVQRFGRKTLTMKQLTKVYYKATKDSQESN